METRQRRESSCGESSNVKVSEPEEGGVSDRVDNLKVAVITGAAQGIGRRTAEVLARKGFTVVLNDLRPPAEAVRSVAQAGGHVLEFAGDITEEQVVLRLCDAVLQRWGRCDVLVNNAGISFIAPAERIAVEDFRRVLEVNLVAPFLLAKAFGALMLKQGSGTIINVASIAGLLGVADRAAYNASKHGLIGLTRTLAAEWGGRGLRVNAVCPGWVKTEMDTADQAGGSYTDADITGRVPMARFASPDDIAAAIAFLADPQQSGFINGHTLTVDGGWTADASWESLRLRHR
jgi:NAD(P)-dependent dehydrogenase (short-subunit alcohol dehydrogenase family)